MGNKKLYSSTKTLHEKEEELKFKGILLPGICAFGKKGKKFRLCSLRSVPGLTVQLYQETKIHTDFPRGAAAAADQWRCLQLNCSKLA